MSHKEFRSNNQTQEDQESHLKMKKMIPTITDEQIKLFLEQQLQREKKAYQERHQPFAGLLEENNKLLKRLVDLVEAHVQVVQAEIQQKHIT